VIKGELVGRNYGSVNYSYWNKDSIANAIGYSEVGATLTNSTGLTNAEMQNAGNFSAFTFTTTPGATGNNWVIVNADGSLNSSGTRGGGTTPMLASEYSTTINNAHQLQLMAMDLGASYTLGSNINAAATGNTSNVWASSTFIPIGNSVNNFTGSFNGLGHTISDLTINLPLTRYVGLFGVARSGIIKNIGMVRNLVIGKSNVGGLVGYSNGSSISNSYATGSVDGTIRTINDAFVGGLVGYSNGSSITTSYAGGIVHGEGDSVGGLVGDSNGTSSISNSYATSTVTVSSDSIYTGGLVGNNSGFISNSYATGTVYGIFGVGGLVGNNTGSISNSYATGTVLGIYYVGGLMGFNSNSSISNNFYDSSVNSGLAGIAGGTDVGVGSDSGLTTSQMTHSTKFTGWDIANTGASGAVWRIYEGNTSPLLTSFLTPLTLTGAPDSTAEYNGGTKSGGTTSLTVDGTLLKGAPATGINVAFFNGYYSTQQGYDLIGGNIIINPPSPSTSTYTSTPTPTSTSYISASLLAHEALFQFKQGNLLWSNFIDILRTISGLVDYDEFEQIKDSLLRQ